jgi:FlaG/FlaF family flagellin (archaellin)
MKGISTILATIMIVIIVVALVSLTYTFAINLFGSSTKPIESSVTQTNQKIDQRVSFIVSPSCQKMGSNYTLSFSIRHMGSTYSIKSSDITVLFNNTQGTLTGWGSDDMAPGAVKSLTLTNNSAVAWSGTGTLTVSAPANPISASVTCP